MVILPAAMLLLQNLLLSNNRSFTENGAVMQFGLGSKRPLKFAGTWYDNNSKRLSAQIEGFVEQARPEVESVLGGKKKHVLAIIAPHAGYMFSGRTAAAGYLAASRAGVKRVFLLGPSHYQSFHGVALAPAKSFATVFGDLDLDSEVVEDLSHSVLFQMRPDVHAQEHSLELQLAFIRKVLGKVKIVPLLLGRVDDAAEAAFLGNKIGEHLGDGDLVVVSSDFTHFGPRYDYMPFKDRFPERVKALDFEALSHLTDPDLGGFFSFFKKTDDTICGVYAIATLLAMLPPQSEGVLLDYRTSREHLAEDDENSVSYMAVAFVSDGGWTRARSEKHSAAASPLGDEEKEFLLSLARRTLESFVLSGRETAPDLGDFKLTEKLRSPHGAFVTLYKRHHKERELRGCIGYILPIKPLYQAVIDNAVGAASRDFRFPAVTAEELQDIEIDINVLTPPHKVAGYKDIRIGVDGILLTVSGRQAVFLPSVAVEYGWTLEETLDQLALKAGLSRGAWKNSGAKFEVFQSEAFEEKN